MSTLQREEKYTTRNLQNTSYSKKERYTRRKRDLKDKRDGVPWAPLVSANPRICHPFQWTQCPLQVRSFTAPLSTSHSHSLSLYSLISWLQSAGPYNYLTNCAGGPGTPPPHTSHDFMLGHCIRQKKGEEGEKREKREKRRETGDRKRETRNRRRETGEGRQEM